MTSARVTAKPAVAVATERGIMNRLRPRTRRTGGSRGTLRLESDAASELPCQLMFIAATLAAHHRERRPDGSPNRDVDVRQSTRMRSLTRSPSISAEARRPGPGGGAPSRGLATGDRNRRRPRAFRLRPAVARARADRGHGTDGGRLLFMRGLVMTAVLTGRLGTAGAATAGPYGPCDPRRFGWAPPRKDRAGPLTGACPARRAAEAADP
jgi:hypothetical protein